MKRSLSLGLLLGALSLSALPAREITVVVEDADLGIPLEGAVIRSWDGTDHVCGGDGSAVITLPDGPLPGGRETVIQGAYPGYAPGRLVIPPGGAAPAGGAPAGGRFVLALRMGDALESRELVIEARKTGGGETKSGRSVAIAEENLARTAETGVIEDVMTSVKLLPGVGYTGMFNAMPSIRGGDPGDLMAALDGYYIESPYHWGGSFSIFDPKMISSAKLSHGVFSSRYGHTVSGLLELSSKEPSYTEFEVDLGISTSATNINLSIPLGERGGLMVMGKVTYWDPFLWAAQQLTTVIDNEILDAVNYVTTAPYIRSTAFRGEYRPASDLALSVTGFFGSDGVGASYDTLYENGALTGRTDVSFKMDNYQGFVIGGFTFNPRPSMLLKGSAGAGFHTQVMDGRTNNSVTVPFREDDFKEGGKYYDYLDEEGKTEGTFTLSGRSQKMAVDDNTSTAQGRVDFDWEIRRGLIFAAGAQELYSRWEQDTTIKGYIDYSKQVDAGLLFPDSEYAGLGMVYISGPAGITSELSNQGFSTAAYALVEYASPGGLFSTELGLRADHFYFIGGDAINDEAYTVQTMPVLNPRFNVDFNLLKNKGGLDALSVTAGTGLFSSINEVVQNITSASGIDDFGIKPNRSWTSLAGIRIDFMSVYSFNLELYYKYIFDRTYTPVEIEPGNTNIDYRFDSIGRVWGFDFMLQKFDSRYFDGWISYSFNYARYRQDPEDGWYFPNFHRFHTFNMILNIRPSERFCAAIRFGFASGKPKVKIVGDITAYPVLVLDAEGHPVGLIEKYKRATAYDDDERTTWSFPLDIKLSFFPKTRYSKVQSEVYLSVENLLSLVYRATGNTSFNSYTGEENTGDYAGSYEMPLPMPSFGFKWSY